MPVDNRDLVATAVELRAAAPEQWEKFVHAMRTYSAGMTAEMTRSPIELLQRAQGMAIAMQEVAGVLNDVRKLHDKYLDVQVKRTKETSSGGW